MRRTMAVLAGLCLVVLGIVCAVPAFATGNPPPNTNEVAYWCGGSDMGVKYDNLTSTSFTVPAPPDGKTWSLLVLKAGSDQSVENENETFTNPVVGESYSHSSGKTLSHAILCYGYATTTTGATTTAPSTTTLPSTTQFTVPTTIATTTTAPTTTQATTTTVPQTTTTLFGPGGCGQCLPQTVTTTVGSTTSTVPATTSPPTTAATTTTVPATTTTAPPSATTSVGQELPHTGPGSTSRDLALAVFLIFAGSATVKWAGASRRRA